MAGKIRRLARRPRLILVAVLTIVGLSAAIVAWAWPEPTTSESDPVWAANWQPRGDLAADEDFMTELTGRIAIVQSGRSHVLWAGEQQTGDAIARSAVFAVERPGHPSGDAARMYVVRQAPNGSWQGGDTTSEIGGFDPHAPGVFLPDVGEGPHGATVSGYLVATGVTAVAALGTDGVSLISVEQPIEDGFAVSTLFDAERPPPACGAPVTRYQTPTGVEYVMPWGGPAVEAGSGPGSPTETQWVALAAGACGDIPEGTPTSPAGRLAVVHAGTPGAVTMTPHTLALPDGRTGTIAEVVLRGADGVRSTLAFVPDGGGPAVYGNPAPASGADGDSAVLINGLSDGPVVLAVSADSAPMTVPELPILAEGAGTTLLGPVPPEVPSVAVITTYADGTVRGAEVVR